MSLLAPWRGRSDPLAKGNGDFFTAMQREMNRVFDRFSHDFDPAPMTEGGEAWLPAMDLKDAGKELVVKAELPGVAEKDLEVTVEDLTLTVKGEKKTEKEEKGKDYYRKECSYGSFQRSLPLPCAVEREKVEATLKDGVLSIRLPKTVDAQTQSKKIAVKAV